MFVKLCRKECCAQDNDFTFHQGRPSADTPLKAL